MHDYEGSMIDLQETIRRLSKNGSQNPARVKKRDP
uniref:Uncharacterized protein n=1 Tax=Medicago truncatula TaxID=3880 RepID=A2Q260_MEDTR|nr:hypothetical protein MtrDRAFT_AC149208g45v2 [Medicago truncatula]